MPGTLSSHEKTGRPPLPRRDRMRKVAGKGRKPGVRRGKEDFLEKIRN